MSTEGSGEIASVVPSLPGAPEQTYLFPKSKGHSRSISHGGTPMLAGNPAASRPLKSALRGHQRALSHGQIGEGGPPVLHQGSGHCRTGSRTDFILPPGHREPPTPGVGLPRPGSVRVHSRQASRSDSIYTLRRNSVVSPWRRTMLRLLRRPLNTTDNRHFFVVPNHLVPEKTPPKDHPNGDRSGNKIRTTKYTLLSFIPKNLFEQFHRVANLYFLFIVLLNFVPALNAIGKEVAMLPVMFVLTVTAVKDLFEDRRRYASDKRINNLLCRVYNRSMDRYTPTKWEDVRVGDLVHLSNNEEVPADMVLLTSANPMGICYIDTCNLDGETNLKQRLVAPGFKNKEFIPKEFKSTVEVERPSTKIYRFNGAISHPDGERVMINSEHLLLRDCKIKNTNYIEGIVVYAGHETKAMLNNGGPRYKASALERRMNTSVIWSVLILLFLCCAGAVGCKMWQSSYNVSNLPPFIPTAFAPAYEGLIKFWTFIIILQVMIPVSLYVTLEMTKLLQVYHLHQDVEMYDPETNLTVMCRALNINEELGQIQYLFTDKTGTLTENKMVFRRCTVGGVDYEHPPGPPAEIYPELPPLVTPVTNVSPNRRLLQHVSDDNEAQHTQKVREFLLILAICNTVVVSQPHVDSMNTNNGDLHNKSKANGTQRPSNDKYSRLAESRSTTPSPPPTTTSPLRLRMPKLTKDSADSVDSASPTETPIIRYEAESPDELALAEAAMAYGYELRVRNPDEVELGIRGVLTKMKVLRIQEFDSFRKCMSVAIRTESGQVALYLKGADSNVLNALAPMRAGSSEAAAYERTRALLSEYSRAGLRTLVIAKRMMTPALWEEWVAGHSRASEIGEGRDKRMRESLMRLESALTLIGATGVEDRLQEDVPRTIRNLLDAGIIVWVLTGDKPETAVNIAYSASVFSQSDRLMYLMSKNKEHAESTIKQYLEDSSRPMAGDSGDGRRGVTTGRALVVDGRTLTYILDRRSGLVAPFLSLARRCSAVLCCRATPLQKAYIVKAVKEELGVITLAIGDGANDVSMIQTADVGVGLSGQEGRQAVMAADFALSRFKFLEKLLLVHGHWSYSRLAKMIRFFFFKNSTFAFVVFWYQLYCGFSTTVCLDQVHWMLYNLLFTAFPPFIIGAYDRVAPAPVLLSRPALYSQSRRGLAYAAHSFWTTLAESMYISMVIFFLNTVTYWGTAIDLYTLGLSNMTCTLTVVTGYVAIHLKSWTVIHVIGLTGSLLSFFTLTSFYQSLCLHMFDMNTTCHIIHHAASSHTFWLLILLTTVTALAPRLMMQAVRGSMCPDPLQRAVAAYRAPRRLPYAATYHTNTASAHLYRSTAENEFAKPATNVTAIT